MMIFSFKIVIVIMMIISISIRGLGLGSDYWLFMRVGLCIQDVCGDICSRVILDEFGILLRLDMIMIIGLENGVIGI